MNKTKLAKRVKALEDKSAEARRYASRAITDEQFVDLFEANAKEGYFDGEPEYKIAIEAYRQAIEDARRFDPTFEPPKDYHRELPIDERRAGWRRIKTFPRITEAFFWLGEIHRRIEAGKSPIREADFLGVAKWFQANEEEIAQRGCIDIGDGRKVDRTNLKVSLAKGPRALEVTELIEDLHRLRSVLGAVPGHATISTGGSFTDG